MRAGQRSENQNQDREHRAGGDGVAQERERNISAGQPLRHDSGADHRSEQQSRSKRLRNRAA